MKQNMKHEKKKIINQIKTKHLTKKGNIEQNKP